MDTIEPQPADTFDTLDEQPVVPRFVFLVTDTHTTIAGPQGDQYMGISVATDTLAGFYRPLPKDQRTKAYKTEMEKMMSTTLGRYEPLLRKLESPERHYS